MSDLSNTMTSFCVADLGGRILRSGRGQASAHSRQAGPGELLYPFRADPRTQYIVDGEAQDRPTMNVTADKQSIIADGVDEITFTGIPIGSALILDGEVYNITEPTLELTVDRPGPYVARFRLWPYIDKEVAFEASTPV
jgi:hypothetical protein